MEKLIKIFFNINTKPNLNERLQFRILQALNISRSSFLEFDSSYFRDV